MNLRQTILKQTKDETWLRAALVALLALYLVNFLWLGFLIGPFDYDHLSAYYGLAWRFWVEQPGKLPHYNPFLCGGQTLGGDPQIPIFHPLILFVPVLGPTWLIKLELLAQLGLGIFGLHRLLLDQGVSPEGRWWGIFLYASGGAVVTRFMVGHVTLGFFFLYPLFLWLMRKERWLLLTWTFVYAGLYKPNFLIYGVPPLLVDVLARSLLQKSFRPIAIFLSALVPSVLVNTISLLPAQRYFSDFPRTFDSFAKFYFLDTFLANLLLPLKAIPEKWYGLPFLPRHEFNLFLGPLALFFAWRGIRLLRSEAIPYFAMAVFCLWLGMGSPSDDFVPWALHSYFEKFWPGFTSIRAPVRFWFGVYLCLVIFSAAGFRRIHTPLFVSLGILPLLLSATINLSKTTVPAKHTQWAPTHPARWQWIRGDANALYLPLAQGYGSLECVQNIQTYQAATLFEGPLLPGTVGRWISWSSFELSTARLVSPERITMNMNHSNYWKSDVATLSKAGESLTLLLPEGHTSSRHQFIQPLMRESFIASAIGWFALLLVSVVVFFRKKRPLPQPR